MKVNYLTSTLLSLMLLLSGDLAADEANLEDKIKASYLYNFTKFIAWPEIKGPAFNLCIFGNDPFGTAIVPIEKKTAFNKPIKVNRLDETEYLSGLASKIDCHILYIGETSAPQKIVDKLQAYSNKASTLVIGDSLDTAVNGEIINFVNRDGKIKLQIHLQAAKRTALKISAKLLEIAELIQDTNDGQ